MIISRTPLRVSFAGGGSDLQSYYEYDTGAVVSTAINKYIYIAVNKSFDGKIIVRYSKEERVTNVDELQHNLIREALKITGVERGVDISSTADVPSEGSGLASSSAYVIGVLHALYAFKGQHVSAERLAKEACHIEIDILQKPIGKQDQYITSYGGFQFIQFNRDGSVYVDPIICLPATKKALQEHLLLFYTGITRSADSILSKQKSNLLNNQNTKNYTKKMVRIAEEMRKMLRRNRIQEFGEFLHENWKLKKKLTDNISSNSIDDWYATALKHGAHGGKILGAGGGGFLLLYALPKYHTRIIEHLPQLRLTDMKFEPQGSKIIYIGD